MSSNAFLLTVNQREDGSHVSISTPSRQTMNKTRSVTNELADFVSNAQWADIPSNVRHEAKRSLVNYFAVALAGSSDPSIAAAISVYGRFSAGNQCRLVGRNERTDILNAAALNAMSANVYDFDDTHLPTIIHPSAPVAAALFALSEDVGLSGEDLLLAFVIGVEVECRLGIALASCHYERGWHITSTCGVFGAAAAVGRALGLDPQAIAWAFGHASAQSSGLVETLGTMSKSVSVGNASRNGILSAILAREGLTGPQNPIEGTRGLLNVMSDHPDPHALADAIGCKWALL